MIKKFNTMDEAYKYYADKLVNEPDYKNIQGTAEILNAGFVVEDAKDIIPYTRGMSLTYALIELVWYFAGSPSTRFINKFASMWGRITDDGFTSNSAYGYILKHKHGFDQIKKVIEMLQFNKYNRRAVLNINVPNVNMIETKDEPCTIALQVNVRDDKLHMTALMRSNDIWFGFPYDVVFFNAVQQVIADRLGIEVGTYAHFATSLHMYDRNREEVKNNLNNLSKNNAKIKIDVLRIEREAKELYNIVDKMENPKKEFLNYMRENGYITEEEK